MIRMLFGVGYCDPGEQRFARLQPKPELVVSFRQAGILPEVEGLVWPSAPPHAEASISAPLNGLQHPNARMRRPMARSSNKVLHERWTAW